ncbi:hypothetical protein C5Y96_15950 [Blastopirellula marina]|uniref:Uncharacterized protein n=1 Tax=Blastopirellula marina TaxID=124 RepID=A0A2S8FAP0_9BACT|nr:MULTISPECIES: hypothetical protein [Pirellulaceae]PQO29238.1 hypothetical protein C5Y96_15950 [Blastopirellula marina]RCS50431.1 hypothetical protein DTL36_15970 [Bremerella cremea]
MIRITCPCCGVGINAEERLIGQTVRCPKCLSITKVVRPKRDDDDLAPVIEPSYETKVYDDDRPQPTDCPKCSKVIPAQQYLCKGCGWHTKLEAYFEDLTEEALAKDTEPKTKMERWFNEQLHELVTHTEFLIAAGLFTAFLGFVAIVVGRIFFGPLLGTIVGLILAAGMAFGWLVLMRRFGALKDPKRDERLHRERMDQRAKVARDPGRGRGAITRPIRVSSSSAEPSPRISLPDEEYNVDDIDLFSDGPVKPRKSSSSDATTSSPQHASSPSGSQKPSKTGDDDWLNDLL